MPVKAPAAVPVVQQQASGYVEVYGGWASTKFRHNDLRCWRCVLPNPFDFDGWALGGAGRANAWLGPEMSVQLDAQGGRHLL